MKLNVINRILKSVIPLYKPIGMTPYQAILRLKQQHPEYADKKISYAGRLDPMAEGLLLLLIGEENKRRSEYEKLPKTYEFTVLLGIETDTYDILGKIEKKSSYRSSVFSHQQSVDQLSVNLTGKPKTDMLVADNRRLKTDNTQLLEEIIKSFIGKRMQKYPPYSSKAVAAKPLYWWARNGRLDEIVIPQKEIRVYDIQLLSQGEITAKDLQAKIQRRTAKVNGNFRQEEVLDGWNRFFENVTYFSREVRGSRDTRTETSFPLLRFRISCSSGTYVRGIAHEIGEKLHAGAIALSIKRIGIGPYTLSGAVRL